jgi:30S ribosomal protein S31
VYYAGDLTRVTPSLIPEFVRVCSLIIKYYTLKVKIFYNFASTSENYTTNNKIKLFIMGKGDKKSRRGKIILGTYGVRRRRKKDNKPEIKPEIIKVKEVKEKKPVKEKKEAVEVKEVKEVHEVKETKVAKEAKEVKAVKEKKEVKAPKAVKEKKEVKETKAPAAGKETAEAKPKKEKKAKKAE